MHPHAIDNVMCALDGSSDSNALNAGCRRHPRRASISIADRYEMMDSRDDVECEPGARHDDGPSMIVRRKAVSPDLGLIECGDITAVLD
jgi:hypothetical protein